MFVSSQAHFINIICQGAQTVPEIAVLDKIDTIDLETFLEQLNVVWELSYNYYTVDKNRDHTVASTADTICGACML